MNTLEDLTIYEKAYTTGNSARKLAHRHGFKNVKQVANVLPENAQVIDVGAGVSTFGNDVAERRPDILWVNFDYSYHNAEVLTIAQEKSPGNVQHIPGDATKLEETYGPETFDAAFSWWLFPHLSLEAIEPAQLAARGIFNITKPGGLISVGPEMNRLFPSFRYQKALPVTKSNDLSVDEFTDMIVDRTYIHGNAHRYMETLYSEVLTPFFGTSRYFDGARVHDHESGTYINPLSRRGLQMIGELSVATAKYIRQTTTEQKI